jgi:hypothetical protein
LERTVWGDLPSREEPHPPPGLVEIVDNHEHRISDLEQDE